MWKRIKCEKSEIALPQLHAVTRHTCEIYKSVHNESRIARGRATKHAKSTCERLSPQEGLAFRGEIYRSGAYRKSLECSSAMDFLSASLRCYRDTWRYFCSCAAPAAERCSHCAALSRDSRGFSSSESAESLHS